jgi:serine/threonine protein kinase
MSKLVGQTILSQYRVEEFIASGGMGAVYRVWDIRRNVPLAMKVLHHDLMDDPAILKYFQREARALKKLAHPNIVPFYGLFQTEELTFMLQEYVDGPTLQDVLRNNPNGMEISEGMKYIKVLCSALGYAHSMEVVHCDIKPGNVMINSGGQVYLADFGIARHAKSTTTTIASAGTPAYMAPEQIRGEEVTPATDVYELGILFYELLTGRRPFRGDEAESLNSGTTAGERIRHSHLNLMPQNPSNISNTIPTALSQVILKALAKKPQDRYPDMLSFFQAACNSLGYSPEWIPSRVILPAQDENLAANRHRTGVFPPSASPDLTDNPPKNQFNLYAILAGASLLICVVIFFISRMNNTNSGQPYIQSPFQTKAAVNGGGATDLPNLTETSRPSAEPVTETPILIPTNTETPTQQILRPGDTRISNIDESTLVYIEPGEFQMGLTKSQINRLVNMCFNNKCTATNFSDAMPVHKVFLDAYWIYKFEVTNQQYNMCVQAGICQEPTALLKTIRITHQRQLEMPKHRGEETARLS